MSDIRNIFIIDDSRVSRMMVSGIAKKTYPEATIFEAANADEALALKLDKELTHIICDYNMPGMDGLTLCESLKKIHSKTYISLLTANIQAAIRNKAQDMGIHFYKKPVTEERVLSILSKSAE